MRLARTRSHAMPPADQRERDACATQSARSVGSFEGIHVRAVRGARPEQRDRDSGGEQDGDFDPPPRRRGAREPDEDEDREARPTRPAASSQPCACRGRGRAPGGRRRAGGWRGQSKQPCARGIDERARCRGRATDAVGVGDRLQGDRRPAERRGRRSARSAPCASSGGQAAYEHEARGEGRAGARTVPLGDQPTRWPRPPAAAGSGPVDGRAASAAATSSAADADLGRGQGQRELAGERVGRRRADDGDGGAAGGERGRREHERPHDAPPATARRPDPAPPG